MDTSLVRTKVFRVLRSSRTMGAVAALAALGALAATACGGDEGGSDDAAKLVKNQTSGSCDAPSLPPTTLTPLGLNPLGTIATLTRQPKPEEGKGKPSDQVAAEVEAAARNFVNCWNQRRFEQVVALTTEDWHKAHFVLINPPDLVFAADGSPDIPFTIRSMSDVQKLDDGRVSVSMEYTWVHQELISIWYFIKQDGRWMFDQEERQPLDLGVQTTTVNIEMSEFAYKIDTPSVKQAPAIKLRAKNVGGLPHELFLVKLSSGFDPSKLFQTPEQPQGVEFFGHTVETPGDTGEILLPNLAPGNYVMVCQFRFPGGPIPTHSAGGMVAVLTVTE
jgi:uncharacterized cupredoxin-like copper-binding protein